jgi:lycopene cyclase domain-containing protein
MIYAILLLVSIFFPLILSFDKKVAFYKHWKYVLVAISIVAAVFIFFDVILTKTGVWNFNDEYLLGLKLLNLPLEEWLFFIFVPYACLFIHYVLKAYFPRLRLAKKTANMLSVALIALLFIILIFNFDKIYTAYIAAYTILVIGLSFLIRSNETRYFYVTFLVMLIPFIMVNSILTGSFIKDEVVWYNNIENLSIRFLTIPIEDFAYAFSLIFSNLLVIDVLSNSRKSQIND